MKWVALVIVLVIVPYTFLTLRFRKPGPAFEPHADMKNRANVIRLLSAGYQRIPVPAQRAAEPVVISTPAPTSLEPGGLPAELRDTLVAQPLLPLEILNVYAAPITNALLAYPIQFTCILPDDKQHLAGADLYVKDDQIVITPTFERVPDGLLTRTRQPLVVIRVPAGALKPGGYQVTLVGERTSRGWSLEVR